jgi:hypothetical protein
MELKTYNPNTSPRLDNQLVHRRKLGKLYYLHDGRNAWYSVWVQRYLDGCMHATLKSAKDNAEALRVQGSVLYIHEMPALLLESKDLVLAITQINCSDVLAGYSAIAVSDQLSPGYVRVENSRNNYLQRGSSLEGAYLSFEHDSRFWKVAPPFKNSVIRVFERTRIDTFEPLTTRLLGYQSHSSGRNWRLGWNECKNEVRSTSLRKLLKPRPLRRHSTSSKR